MADDQEAVSQRPDGMESEAFDNLLQSHLEGTAGPPEESADDAEPATVDQDEDDGKEEYEADSDSPFEEEGYDLPDDEQDADDDDDGQSYSDVDDDDAPEDEDDEEQEYEDDDDDEIEYEADDTEDVLEAITDQDLDRIEKDASLNKVYRSMQKAFTQKTQEVAEVRRELELRETSVDSFRGQMQTPEGVAAYIKAILENGANTVVGAAFESAATGPKAKDFLIEVALHSPETFEGAYERYLEIAHDPDERKHHERAKELQEREHQVQQRELLERRARFDDSVNRIKNVANKAAQKHRIHEDDFGRVTEKLSEAIRANEQRNGTVKLSDSETRKLVAQAATEIQRSYEVAERKVRRQTAQRSQKRAREKARKASRAPRLAPRPRAARRPTKQKGWKPTGKGDALEEFVDFFVKTKAG